MTDAAVRRATYADLEAVPPHLVAEIIDGRLVTHPRPTARHGRAANRLGFELTGPFELGRGGPGGWVFIAEPELRLAGNTVVPDIAGWRAERMITEPERAAIETPPDWVCEILSPSTSKIDRGAKRNVYADAGVPRLWLVDPDDRLLDVFVLTASHRLRVAIVEGGQDVRCPPFDAIGFPFDDLFPFDAPPSTEA